MPSLHSEDVELLLQVARDASLGRSFRERFDGISDTLTLLIPATSLSVVVIAPQEQGQHAFFKNNELKHLLTYVEHYREADPMGETIAQAMGTPHLLSDFVGPHSFGQDAYTGEFLQPHHIRHIMGVTFPTTGDGRLALAIQREPGLGDFSAKEKEILRLAGPDIVRAALGSLLRERLDDLSKNSAAESENTSGAMILDAKGGLVHAEKGALELCKRLCPERVPAEILVHDARRLSGPSAREGSSVERVVALEEGALLRIRSTALESSPDTHVLSVLEQIELGSRDAFEAVAERAGLTVRERSVAALAVQGLGNRHIGKELGIATVTVGVHLSSVYRKTRVTGRTELARLMSGGPLWSASRGPKSS